jgi:hypothetical protein
MVVSKTGTRHLEQFKVNIEQQRQKSQHLKLATAPRALILQESAQWRYMTAA